MLKLTKLVLNWLYSHATARIYSSPTPIGRRLGGHDIQQLPNEYIILDVSVAGKIIVLGYFQLT